MSVVAEGPADGTAVGVALGARVGANVGSTATVGAMLGAALGAALGALSSRWAPSPELDMPSATENASSSSPSPKAGDLRPSAGESGSKTAGGVMLPSLAARADK